MSDTTERVKWLIRRMQECDEGCIPATDEGRLASHSADHMDRREAAALLESLATEKAEWEKDARGLAESFSTALSQLSQASMRERALRAEKAELERRLREAWKLAERWNASAAGEHVGPVSAWELGNCARQLLVVLETTLAAAPETGDST